MGVAHATSQELRRRIGERLRHFRERSNVGSQEHLAVLAGVHRTYVGRLERGESGVTVESLSAILIPMSVPLAEFFKPFRVPLATRSPRRRPADL